MKRYTDPQLAYSEQRFSLNRLAYSLDAVSLLLFALYWFVDTTFGNRTVMGVACVLTIVVLVLCLLTQRTVRHRWLPFLVAFVLLFIHGLFVPHL
jgi:sugar phosphate permease